MGISTPSATGALPAIIKGMWLMLQAESPMTMSGDRRDLDRTPIHRTRLCVAGITLTWNGSGVDETGQDTASGRTLVRIDPRYFRPTEVELLIGDASKARRELGWEPEMDFETLVRTMTIHDMREAGLSIPG